MIIHNFFTSKRNICHVINSLIYIHFIGNLLKRIVIIFFCISINCCCTDSLNRYHTSGIYAYYTCVTRRIFHFHFLTLLLKWILKICVSVSLLKHMIRKLGLYNFFINNKLNRHILYLLMIGISCKNGFDFIGTSIRLRIPCISDFNAFR